MSDKKLIEEFLRDRNILVLSTLDNGKPWISTVYYGMDNNFNLVFTSSELSVHAQNLLKDSDCACAIYNHESSPKTFAEGIQMSGKAKLATLKELPTIFKLLSKTLPEIAKKLSLREILEQPTKSNIFVFKPNLIKYIGPDKKINIEIKPHNE